MDDSNALVMNALDLEIEANKIKACELAEELRNLTRRTHKQENKKKATEKVNENRTYQSDRLTHKERKANAVIKPEVRELIRENVIGNGMKVSEAMKTFKVSRRQIQRIKTEDPSLVKTVKKRPGKFTDEMKTELLHQLEQKSSTTLTELARFIKEKFDVTVSTQAISNLIHDMDITWKQTTNIPTSWNKPQLIEL